MYEMEEKTREVWSILELPQTRRGTRRGKRSAAGFKLHYTWSLSPDTMSAIRAFSPATVSSTRCYFDVFDGLSETAR